MSTPEPTSNRSSAKVAVEGSFPSGRRSHATKKSIDYTESKEEKKSARKRRQSSPYAAQGGQTGIRKNKATVDSQNEPHATSLALVMTPASRGGIRGLPWGNQGANKNITNAQSPSDSTVNKELMKPEETRSNPCQKLTYADMTKRNTPLKIADMNSNRTLRSRSFAPAAEKNIEDKENSLVREGLAFALQPSVGNTATASQVSSAGMKSARVQVPATVTSNEAQYQKSVASTNTSVNALLTGQVGLDSMYLQGMSQGALCNQSSNMREQETVAYDSTLNGNPQTDCDNIGLDKLKSSCNQQDIFTRSISNVTNYGAMGQLEHATAQPLTSAQIQKFSTTKIFDESQSYHAIENQGTAGKLQTSSAFMASGSSSVSKHPQPLVPAPGISTACNATPPSELAAMRKLVQINSTQPATLTANQSLAITGAQGSAEIFCNNARVPTRQSSNELAIVSALRQVNNVCAAAIELVTDHASSTGLDQNISARQPAGLPATEGIGTRIQEISSAPLSSALNPSHFMPRFNQSNLMPYQHSNWSSGQTGYPNIPGEISNFAGVEQRGGQQYNFLGPAGQPNFQPGWTMPPAGAHCLDQSSSSTGMWHNPLPVLPIDAMTGRGPWQSPYPITPLAAVDQQLGLRRGSSALLIEQALRHNRGRGRQIGSRGRSHTPFRNREFRSNRHYHQNGQPAQPLYVVPYPPAPTPAMTQTFASPWPNQATPFVGAPAVPPPSFTPHPYSFQTYNPNINRY